MTTNKMDKIKKRKHALLIFIILILCSVSSFSQSQLTDEEKMLVEYVDKHNADGLALLEQVVNINSGTMNSAGVRKVSDIFRGKLEALGFKTRWVSGKSFNRSGHLIAERTGQGPRLLLIGHLDTVFESDSPFQKFEMINDSTASGPGIGDMKGGDVIIVQALQALSDVGVLKDMNVAVIMTGDEERPGKPLELARRDLIDAAKLADIAIGFENGDGDPTTAIVARRSSSHWQLTVHGKPAHSSQLFQESVGAGAIYEAARILNGFYERLAGQQYLTFNPGRILGGTDVNNDAS